MKWVDPPAGERRALPSPLDPAGLLLFVLILIALASWAAYAYLQTHAGIVVVSR